jgi:hypothetical protein
MRNDTSKPSVVFNVAIRQFLLAPSIHQSFRPNRAGADGGEAGIAVWRQVQDYIDEAEQERMADAAMEKLEAKKREQAVTNT